MVFAGCWHNPAVGCWRRVSVDRSCGAVVEGGRFVECEDASATDDAAQWKIAVADGRLDRADETATAGDAMSAWERLHRRRGTQANYALNTPPPRTPHDQTMY